MSARNELDQIKKEGREDWLRQREQEGPSLTLEEILTTGPPTEIKTQDLMIYPAVRT